MPRHAESASTLYTLHSTLYTLHSTPYTLHSTLYTLHPTLHTLHPTPYTRHPRAVRTVSRRWQMSPPNPPQPRGKSQVNLPQMPPDSGGICMGVE